MNPGSTTLKPTVNTTRQSQQCFMANYLSKGNEHTAGESSGYVWLTWLLVLTGPTQLCVGRAALARGQKGEEFIHGVLNKTADMKLTQFDD